jgi:hypothetical protein
VRFLSKHLSSAVLAAALISPVLLAGCAARVYDADHGDYHHWNHGEDVYYTRWEGETHRDHVDFKARPAADQKEYWNWRHNQK